MSGSAPPPTSGTSGVSPPPPAPVAQGPLPSNANLSPPVIPPPPPSLLSNSPPAVPPASTKPNSPPLASPPEESSPPPPPPPNAASPLPTPPPPHNAPKSSTPPPSIPLPPPKNPFSPPNAAGLSSPPLSNTPPKVEQPPTSSPLPLVVSPPPPQASQGSLPVVVGPTLSPPAQSVTPVVPKTPTLPPPSSDLPESPPSTSNPTPSTPTTPVIPSPSLTPNTKPENNARQLTPPAPHSKSSSSVSSSISASDKTGNVGSGVVVGMTLAGVVVALVAIFFVILRKKKRRSDGLASHYRPPTTFSAKSDGYYYEQANPAENPAGSDAYYASRPPASPSATGNTFGSHRGYGSHTGPPESSGIGNSKSWFSYEEISDMTHGFSQQHLLGEGGFGCVYKGWLPDGRVVAVKQLKAGSGQGEREFQAEVEIISRVHHRHLVSLVGYCVSDHHRSLVYEFVPNNTLEHHLHGKGMPVMEWSKRVKMAIGSARGLAYLHEDCHPRIIHRDIKSANILLDDSFEAKVADFGLAKLSNDTNTHISTRVMGTFGYMAPEYASSGKLTDRSDVFSFGVVLLELITGRKPVDPSQPLGDESLVEWARPLLVHALETGNFEELADPRLQNDFVTSEMFRMTEAAAACVRHSAPKRPRMVQVVRALDSEGELSDLTNGVKFGQSTVFDSGQYSADIQKFRRMAFGSDDCISECGTSGEYGGRSSGKSSTNSGEYRTREAPHKPLNPWRTEEFNTGEQRRSHEAEPRAMNHRGSDRSSEGSYQFNVRGHV